MPSFSRSFSMSATRSQVVLSTRSACGVERPAAALVEQHDAVLAPDRGSAASSGCSPRPDRRAAAPPACRRDCRTARSTACGDRRPAACRCRRVRSRDRACALRRSSQSDNREILAQGELLARRPTPSDAGGTRIGFAPQVTRSRSSRSRSVATSREARRRQQHRARRRPGPSRARATASHRLRRCAGASRDDRADRIESVRARRQRSRAARSAGRPAQMRIVERRCTADCWRSDRSVRPASGANQSPQRNSTLPMSSAPALAARDRQRVRARIGGDHLRTRTLVRQSQRDGAAAGAEVGDARSARSAGRRASASSTSSSVSGRGISVSGVTARSKRQKPRRPVEVGHRLAGGATAPPAPEALRRLRFERVVAVREQPAARLAEHVRQQTVRRRRPCRCAARNAAGNRCSRPCIADTERRRNVARSSRTASRPGSPFRPSGRDCSSVTATACTTAADLQRALHALRADVVLAQGALVRVHARAAAVDRRHRERGQFEGRSCRCPDWP